MNWLISDTHWVNKVGIALAIALLSMTLLATPVYAITNPTSGPTIEEIDVYRHCLETDDMLVVVQYYLDYDTNPDETITQAYLGRFMNATGAELTNVAPYAYYDKGYDHGIFSMYLTASEAATYWGTACTVRFEGNPTLSWPGDPPSTTGTTLNWQPTASQAATRLALGAKILTIAEVLSDYWSVALTSQTTEGMKLSSYGQQYFTTTIPNLRTMSSIIFPAGLGVITYEEREYTRSYTEQLKDRWAGTLPETGFQGLSDWTSMPLDVVKAILWFIAMGLIAYFIVTAVKDLRPAAFSVIVMVPCGNLLGMLSLTFTVIAGLIAILALGYAFFYQKAT